MQVGAEHWMNQIGPIPGSTGGPVSPMVHRGLSAGWASANSRQSQFPYLEQLDSWSGMGLAALNFAAIGVHNHRMRGALL